MNVFGGMGFARIIKTFVPGLFLVLSFVGYFDLILSFWRGEVVIGEWAIRNTAMAISIASVVSIAVGILSNMVVFTYATDRLIRAPFANQFAELEFEEAALTRAVSRMIREDAGAVAEGVPLDVEYLLFRELPLDKLTYLQEGYWYYLEFQMNMGLALLVASPLTIAGAGFMAYSLDATIFMSVAVSVVMLILLMMILALLLKTARINFTRHRTKRFSMMLAAYANLKRMREPGAVTIPTLAEIRYFTVGQSFE